MGKMNNYGYKKRTRQRTGDTRTPMQIRKGRKEELVVVAMVFVKTRERGRGGERKGENPPSPYYYNNHGILRGVCT